MEEGDEAVRARLLAQRSAVRGRLATLTDDHADVVAASEDSNADDEHDPEGATVGFERAQLAAVIASTRRSLAEYDAALARLAEGRYGYCLRCAAPIGPARLEARPTAAECIVCASR